MDNEMILRKIRHIEDICHKIENKDNSEQIVEILCLLDGMKLYL